MANTYLEVSIKDGPKLIEQRRCRRATLPDGRPGVLWRGLLFALDDDCIDVNHPAPDKPAPPSPPPFAVVRGDTVSWVLLQGTSATMTAAAGALRAGGITVFGDGRWLGDPVQDQAFDWFLRCGALLEQAQVAALLAARPIDVGTDPATRIAFLEQQLAETGARLARVEDALRRADRTALAPAPATPSTPDPALLDALAELDSVRQQLAMTIRQPTVVPAPMRRFVEEIDAMLTALRPDITFIRKSLDIVGSEFRSRASFYRLLGEVPVSGGKPDGWKMLRGAERWWERHLSTGQSDDARAYARFDTARRGWDVLIGWKVEQKHDIEWLQRQQ